MGLLKRLTDALKGEHARPTESHPHTGNLDQIDTTGPFPAGSLDLNEGFKPTKAHTPYTDEDIERWSDEAERGYTGLHLGRAVAGPPVKGYKPQPADLISGEHGPKRVVQRAQDVDLNDFNAAVRQHLAPLGATWLRDFWGNHELQSEHGITKVHVDGEPVLIQLPGNILAEVDESGLDAYDLTDPDAITWLVRGAKADLYLEEETGDLTVAGDDYDLTPEETYPEWDIVDPTTPLTDLTVGGPTDFAAREDGQWPHYRHPDGSAIPMRYIATFRHQGELYDFFYDFPGGDFLDEAYGPYSEHHYMSAYAFIAHNRALRILPAWVELKALPAGEAGPIADERRYQLPTEVPRAPHWIQETEVPAAPHNHFVIEIPSVSVDLMFGDMGSIYVFSNGANELRGVYQCY
jgi:hypothetical protein